MDAHSNFGYSTVLVAPAPELSGTSLTVQAGQGALFPVAPFNCTVWPAGVTPLASNAEIVRVTAVVGDTLTITRAQEGTAAISIGVGYQIGNTATNKVFTDIENAIAAAGTVTSVGVSAPAEISVGGSPVVGAGTITLSWVAQAANLVFCGPSSGGAATPAFRSLVESDMTLSDVTTNNATAAAHGFCPKLSNVATEFLNGVGGWAVPAGGGGSDWDTVITKSADQTVTDNATPQNDSELFTTLDADSFYLIELLLLFSGNNTAGDYRCHVTFPAHVATTLGSVLYSGSTGTTVLQALNQASSTQWPNPDIIAFADTAANIRTIFIQMTLLVAGAGGTFQFKFANSVAGAGRDSTTVEGSTLRVKKLYP